MALVQKNFSITLIICMFSLTSLFTKTCLAENIIKSDTINITGEVKLNHETKKDSSFRRKTKISFPTIAVMFGKKGFKNSFGPGLNIKHAMSTNEVLTFRIEYLPLKFKELGSSAKLEYLSYDLKYVNAFRKDMFYELSLHVNNFRPDSGLVNYVAGKNSKIEKRTLFIPEIAIGKKIFDLKINFRHKKYTKPVYLKMYYTFGKNYDYGTEIGDAGREFKTKKGLKFGISFFEKNF